MLTFRRANNLLIVLIVLVNGYVIAAPFMPELLFLWQKHATNRAQTLTSEVKPSDTYIPGPNKVIVPSMLLEQPVLEGTVKNQYHTLDKGIWRWPSGSTPDRGSNTILIGHRFTYTNPRGVFYQLDKVRAGDTLAVVWNHHRYTYRVTNTRVVRPTDTSIENPTNEPILTLFTCTPTWWPHNRLVVTAKLESR
jgi:sortase A